MFDIAWSELLVIAVVALIFIGPKELPGMLHTLGRFVRKVRNHADDFRRQFDESMKQGGYEDLQKNLQDFRALNPAGQLKDSIKHAIEKDYLTPAPSAAQPPAPAVQSAEATTAATATPTSKPEGGDTASPASAAAPQIESQTPAPAPTPASAAPEAQAATHLETGATHSAQPSHSAPAKPLEPQATASDPAKDRIAPAA